MIRSMALALATVSIVASCTSADSQPAEIVLLTHDSFAVSDATLAAFTEETGVAVRVLRSGDAGTMVNQAILTADNPIADVLFGVDNTFLSRAVAAGVFSRYRSPALDTVDVTFHVEGDMVTPIDYGDVCVNYDRAAFDESVIPIPAQLADLADPVYAGRFVVQNPATSSPGLAFLLSTIGTFGEGDDYNWKDYWTDLFANDVHVTSGWSEAYYTVFSGGSGEGSRPLVVSYASSPPAEVYFGELDESPTGVIAVGCFRQIEYAGVLAGTKNEAFARKLIDFMLSPTFQQDIPLNMFVFPANREAALPDVFIAHVTPPIDPIVMEPARIEENRERWIEEWTELAR